MGLLTNRAFDQVPVSIDNKVAMVSLQGCDSCIYFHHTIRSGKVPCKAEAEAVLPLWIWIRLLTESRWRWGDGI